MNIENKTMKIQNVIFGLVSVIACQEIMSESFENLLQTDPGMQAKMGRASAQVNTMGGNARSGHDRINQGCNQNIGNIDMSQVQNSNLREHTVIVTGNIINVCK